MVRFFGFDWEMVSTFSSPHVAQRFVFSGGPEGASQPELAQLESQRGEWTVQILNDSMCGYLHSEEHQLACTCPAVVVVW